MACVSLAAFRLYVTISVHCCCGAETLVTLSRFLTLRRCGLPVGWMHCRLFCLFLLFFFWFSFFHNKPIGQVMVALPRRTFSGSHKFQNSLCALLKDLVGGGSSTLGCFWLFLLFDFYLIDGIRDVLRLNN